jgi:hypothetical protein
MDVSFFLHGERGLATLGRLDPDHDFREFQTGERAWILQTYLRLRAAGFAVNLREAWPRSGLLVFDARQKDALRRLSGRTDGVFLVGCRRDVGQPLIADFEVLQNGCFADGDRRFLVPHWPQPGLVPRDSARGARIERISYKGFAGNLDPGYLGGEWRRFLARVGIEWQCDAVPYAGPQDSTSETRWHDFRECDLILAVRPPARDLHVRKPATKLYNAWLAGVPAILGVEYAYRELRRNALDYIEVSSVAEAMQAVEALARDPARYVAMVQNGRLRTSEFTPEAIRSIWADLLFRVLPERVNDAHARRWQGKPLWLKSATRRMTRYFKR